MKKHSSFLKWLIWGLAATFYFYEFVLRVSPSVMVSELMESFGITASTVGILSAFYLYAYAPMQIPVGIVMDHFGVKKVLSIASLICGIGAVLFAATNYLSIASFGRFLIGTGSAFAFIAMIYITSHWFSLKKRAFLIGIANSLAMLGASAGAGGPLSVLIKNFGWQRIITILGFFGIFLGVVIYIVFKFDNKDERVEEKTAQKDTHIFKNLQKVISKKNTWINSFAALFFYITTTAFGGLWGLSFVQTAYDVSKDVAGYAISMIFLGWLIGGPLMGLISDLIGKRTTTIRIGIIGALICLFIVIYFPVVHIYAVYGLLFLLGLFSSAELLNFSLAIELNSFRAKATAAAFTNFVISCGDAASQYIVGFLLDNTWSGKIVEGIRYYGTREYQIALSILPAAMIIAFFLMFFIKENKVAIEA
ncbi:MAG: putative sulfoacetate transporter SauU [Candidatus Anoxychlamydiales bacterium]|nr:putative sulfoacetate transporter SauU [Candidatus Anoxychlamydiales bacterium]NGX36059.1 putative sulfoacetate transporter SauU [Candidatus Anoxychlamydiales bacterium]